MFSRKPILMEYDFKIEDIKDTYYFLNIVNLGNEKCYIEDSAVQQLNAVGNLEDVIRGVGLPDLHPGKGPVGIAAETEKRIYPHLIGNDIGCGMRLIKTGVVKRRFKKDRYIFLPIPIPYYI